MNLLLIWYDVADYAQLGNFSILEDLVPLNKESGFCYIYTPNTLQESTQIILHGLTTLGFVWNSHEVPVIILTAYMGR